MYGMWEGTRYVYGQESKESTSLFCPNCPDGTTTEEDIDFPDPDEGKKWVDDGYKFEEVALDCRCCRCGHEFEVTRIRQTFTGEGLPDADE